eukprot:UN01572
MGNSLLFEAVPEDNWAPRYLTNNTEIITNSITTTTPQGLTRITKTQIDKEESPLGWSCQFIHNTTAGKQQLWSEALPVVSNNNNILQFNFTETFSTIPKYTPFLLYCPNWIITAPVDTDDYAEVVGDNTRFYLAYAQNDYDKEIYLSNFSLPYLNENRPPLSGYPYILSPLRLAPQIDHVMIEIDNLEQPQKEYQQLYFTLNITGITPLRSE